MNRLQELLSLEYLSPEDSVELIELLDMQQLEALTYEQLIFLEGFLEAMLNMANDFYAGASVKKPKISGALLDDVRNLIDKCLD